MIPQIFHQIWIDPSGDLSRKPPADVLQNCIAWQIAQARHAQRLWSLPEILQLCTTYNMPDVAESILSCRFPSMQADLGRLLLLQLFGGYWIDLKLYPLRSFLHEFDSINLVLTEHFTKPDLPDPTGHLSNSFIGSAKGHPLIVHALRSATENVRQRRGGSIYAVTGAPNIKAALSGEVDHKNFRLLKHYEAWDTLFEIRGGSYNGADMHWSLREAREKPYV